MTSKNTNKEEEKIEKTQIPKEEFDRIRNSRSAEVCPYCLSTNFVKRGTRQNVGQVVQLYLCKNVGLPDGKGCGRTFSAQDIKGKHFPLHIIIEAMSYYNIGLNLVQTCEVIKQKFGVAPEPATLSDWINEYKMLCRYERLRPYAIKMFGPKETIEVVTMAHRQLYRFRYHRPKTILMLEEFRNRALSPLKSYLDNVSSETPHQYFQDGERMSEIRSKFDKADMIVRSKFNYANRLTAFVLQSIPDNKQRHEEIQRFMIANDSCTVATEVPVYIRKEDVEHMENVLKFKIVEERPSADFDGSMKPSSEASRSGTILLKGDKQPRSFPKLLTGHIDFVQIRNGQVHLLDYKPNASKEKPIEQLTWYALAMSRLTGLRLYNFVCAWFDEKDYYQFYPLHVVKKISGNKKRRVYYRSGEVVEVSKENVLKVIPRSINEYKNIMLYQKNNYGKFVGGGTGYSAQRTGKFGTGTFTPRKPVRSFRDLDIYQKTLECSVLIVKDLVPELEKLGYSFRENMVNCCMSVPLYISESHSMRFASFEGGVMLLEKAMAGCNKMIVYLEQMKGVYGAKLDVSLIDDLINRYADSRTKSWHLEKSWKKFKLGEISGEIKPKTGFKY